MSILAVFGDAAFESVCSVFRLLLFRALHGATGTTPAARQVVVLIERVVGAIANYPHRLGNGERVTRDTHRYLGSCLFALGRRRGIRLATVHLSGDDPLTELGVPASYSVSSLPFV